MCKLVHSGARPDLSDAAKIGAVRFDDHRPSVVSSAQVMSASVKLRLVVAALGRARCLFWQFAHVA
jgi:hypothetical protein